MSILIKDMEMPEDAERCKFYQPAPFRDPYCVINGVCHGIDACPLVPVPPHGRLGDLDALTKEVNRFCDQYDAGIISTSTWVNGILHAIFNAPTIIPAEEGET